MRRFAVLAVSFGLIVTACGDSIEDRAVTEYRERAAEYGLGANMIGILSLFPADGGKPIVDSRERSDLSG